MSVIVSYGYFLSFLRVFQATGLNAEGVPDYQLVVVVHDMYMTCGC